MGQVGNFLTSPWAAGLGIALSVAFGVVGLVTAYIFYRRSLREESPCWSIQTSTVIGPTDETLRNNLEIRYKNRVIERLSVSKVLFWNRGSATMRLDMWAPSDRLRIQATSSDTQLLEAAVISDNNAASAFTVELADDCKVGWIHYEYMRPGHGCVIRVVHTGLASTDLRVVGSAEYGRPLELIHLGTGASEVSSDVGPVRPESTATRVLRRVLIVLGAAAAGAASVANSGGVPAEEIGQLATDVIRRARARLSPTLRDSFED
jgi:hypothetical protein